MRDDLGVHRLGLLGADQVVDVVDQAVVVAVGDLAGRGGAGLAAGLLVLVVLDDLDVGVDVVEVRLVVRAAGGAVHPLVDQVDASGPC